MNTPGRAFKCQPQAILAAGNGRKINRGAAAAFTPAFAVLDSRVMFDDHSKRLGYVRVIVDESAFDPNPAIFHRGIHVDLQVMPAVKFKGLAEIFLLGFASKALAKYQLSGTDDHKKEAHQTGSRRHDAPIGINLLVTKRLIGSNVSPCRPRQVFQVES